MRCVDVLSSVARTFLKLSPYSCLAQHNYFLWLYLPIPLETSVSMSSLFDLLIHTHILCCTNATFIVWIKLPSVNETKGGLVSLAGEHLMMFILKVYCTCMISETTHSIPYSYQWHGYFCVEYSVTLSYVIIHLSLRNQEYILLWQYV